MRIQQLSLALLLLWLLGSCTKSITIDPPKNELTSGVVFTDSAATLAAVSGLYMPFSRHGGSIESYFTVYPSLYADEIYPLATPSASIAEYYNSSILPTNIVNGNIWSQLYKVVYGANSLIEGLDGASTLSPSFKAQAEGEALFLRAFAYLHLVTTYGDVPLVLTTSAASQALPRAPQGSVYNQLIADLKLASNKLLPTYPGPEKIRANRWAAQALLARAQLYREDWTAAGDAATAVINAGIYGPLPPLNSVFQRGSREAILQFWARDGFTWAGTFIPASGNPPYALTPSQLAAFVPGDGRLAQWTRAAATGSARSPHKYKNRVLTTGTAAEYSVALRLAELYLIRAEARLHQEKIPEALTDLNMVRIRAGLPAVTGSISKDSLFTLIVRERQAELFTEWGHRLADLKRWGKTDAVLGPLKTSWKSGAKWYPVPDRELLLNPALTQNDGY